MKKKLIAVMLLVLIVTVVAVTIQSLNGDENLLNLFFGGTIEKKLQQVESPNGRSVAILPHKYKHGPGRPPEPPKILERWSRLKLLRNGESIYDSGYENLNVYQMGPGFALDAMWSPDSRYLAYRHITSFHIIGPNGKATAYDVAPEDYVISSFRWIDNERLLVVSKKTRYPLDMFGKPYMYNGYTDHAKGICITQLDLVKGKTDRYRQVLDKPTFLFHAINFCMDEISPKGNRVAFSDGANLCVYDDTVGKLVAQVKIPQKQAPTSAEAFNPAQLEGVWWQTNDSVVIGVGLLSSANASYAFYTYDIPSKVLTDKSSVLLPLWLSSNKIRNYLEPDWFRSAMK